MYRFLSRAETLFLFPEAGGEIRAATKSQRVPSRACVIVPPGDAELSFSGSGRVYALTTGAIGLDSDLIINSADYREPDRRVKPLECEPTVAEHLRGQVRVYLVEDIPYPVGNPRLKFLRTATMSINWVEYDGPRDRRQLSPHAHADFEQGSLAIAGDFIHHIRTPWMSDANQWRDDEHIGASSDSMLIIPPQLIHTTEGVGSGHHILIDVFAPSRNDFSAKGWIHNVGDYVS
jgi:hypothetical protein